MHSALTRALGHNPILHHVFPQCNRGIIWGQIRDYSNISRLRLLLSLTHITSFPLDIAKHIFDRKKGHRRNDPTGLLHPRGAIVTTASNIANDKLTMARV